MTPDEWSLVGKIYEAALEREDAERKSFVVNACGGNEWLRSEVASLLAAEREAGEFLESPPAEHIFDPASVEPPLMAGKLLQQYELLSVLGSGGMGAVYRALDTRLKREVAIKILRTSMVRDMDRLRRFEQEAQAASSLNHPNIVTIYEAAEAEGCRFIAMELVQGQTLRRIIDARPSFGDVIPICLQVARALRVAHAARIVHRDIKPENVMLRPDGYVKVLDFGLARLSSTVGLSGAETSNDGTGVESRSAITEPGILVGTLRYMSPEQAEGKPVTGASDIFSLGIMLYELATARHPFRVETEFGTLDAILSQATLAPSKVNPAIPMALEQLILGMLEKQAEARPSAAEVERRLAEVASTGNLQAIEASFQNSKHTVGRKRELARLKALWDSATAARGTLCCISGEPGIGKTTLVEDFLLGLKSSERPYLVARGRCSEQLAGTDAYSPFLEALDGLQYCGASVAESMKRLAPTWYRQVVSGTVSGAALGRPRPEPAYSQERMNRELSSLLQQLSRHQSVLLFLEDLHWADISTVDLLAFLVDRIADSRLLLVITYRPSDLLLNNRPLFKVKQDLRARGVAHEIELDFLRKEEVAQYIELEFPQHRLPVEVAELIHAKTEGSPLFMTDLLRYFRDREIITKNNGGWELARPLADVERDVPESTRAMIERMIGQLDEHDRPLLVAASVQGPEFDSAVLARALGRDDAEVEEQLERLQRVHQFAELIEEREFPTKALTLRYRFTHVLYQNALYATLLPARRVAMSNAVGEALLSLYCDQCGTVASDLARLFEAGRRFVHAAQYYLMAATNASRIFAANEAVALAQRGLSAICSAPETLERREIEFALHLVLGNALLVVRGYGATEVEVLYERAYSLCSKVGQPAQLLPILYGLWVSHLVHGKLERALGYGTDFLDLANKVQSAAVLVGERMLGCVLFYLGRLTEARPYFERAISIYDPAQHRALAWLYGQEPGMTAHSYLAWTLWLLGYPDQAAEHNRKSLQLAREVEHGLSRGHGLFFAAVFAFLCRDWGELRGLANDLVCFSRERNLAFWLPAGRILSGLIVTRDGDALAGIEEMRKAIDDSLGVQTRLCLTIHYRALAEAYAHAQRYKEALAAIQAARTLIEGTHERFFEPELHRFQGELLLREVAGPLENEAEECFRRAVDTARQHSAKSWELRASVSLSRLWLEQGKQSQVFELLAPLCHWFKEGDDTADLNDARALLEELR